MNHRVFAPALVALMALAPAAHAASSAGVQATANVNVRSSAWGTVLAVVPAGSTWVSTGNTDQGFVEVFFRGQRAWISEKYLESASGTGARVAASALNVRSAPSTSASVVGQVYEQQAYAVAQETANGLWSLIRYDENQRWIYKGYTVSFSLAAAPGTTPPTTPSTPTSGASFVAKGTGYYPFNSALEGGFKDRMGKPLQTLQAFLAGNASYVSVAMDSKAFAYGTKLRIREFEQRYGRAIEFRVVDTGGAFKGTGTSRIDVCVANKQASYDPTVNGTLHCEVVH